MQKKSGKLFQFSSLLTVRTAIKTEGYVFYLNFRTVISRPLIFYVQIFIFLSQKKTVKIYTNGKKYGIIIAIIKI